MDTLKTALKLMPVARALIALAQTDAPSYRPASEQARCANCAHFDGSACRRFDFAAGADYICDDYDGRNPMQELKAFVEKYGARNSRVDQAAIQDAHDLMVRLGAMCGGLESKSALVWRHPGHPNQKVHGNRFGSYGAAKESLRRLKDDKAARERYKATGRKRSSLSKADRDKFKYDESLKMVKEGRVGKRELQKNLDAVNSKLDNYKPFYGSKKDLQTMKRMLESLMQEAS